MVAQDFLQDPQVRKWLDAGHAQPCVALPQIGSWH